MCILPSDTLPIHHPLQSLIKCSQSSQCTDDRWFCNRKGRCECKLDYVQIGTQCWKKIPVGSQEECVFDKQCGMVWPTAKCIKRKCSCVPPQIPVSTYHGTVCTYPDSCPMGTQNSVLYHTQNCHLRGGCGENIQLTHFFDCITFGSSSSMCCPNKAYTCMQPKMPGNGPQRLMRYYYDAPSEQCRPFMFRGGNMVNTNIFQSKADCEIYCRSDCPIGLAEKGKSETILYCNKDDDCGSLYGCLKKDVADRGVCCPQPSWICSPDGGRDYTNEKPRIEEYDVGVAPKHVISVFYPVIRYYYSVSEHRCKAFMYQGEGGNFNQFESLEHCQQYCSPVSCGGNKALILEGKIVTCSTEEPCIEGFDCKYGLCCPRKAEFCLDNYEVFMEVDDEGNQRGRPLQCKHDADCPVPYVCQLTNRLSRTSLRGYCCRALEKTGLKKNEKYSTKPISTTEAAIVIENKGSSLSITGTPMTYKKVDQISTTTMTTSTPSPSPESSSETSVVVTTFSTTGYILNVTSKPLSLMSCPAGRHPLIDRFGRSIECEITEVSMQASATACGNSTEHQCAFVSLNATRGVCCQRLAYEHNRCPGGMRPLVDIDTRQVILHYYFLFFFYFFLFFFYFFYYYYFY
uniref:BPTI/Kunitz inhibitor domain-containing protein n=1 Tax=Acrobeloides nanus TaxID=290746 RepID=A0A914DWG6_9BILA